MENPPLTDDFLDELLEVSCDWLLTARPLEAFQASIQLVVSV